MISYDQIRAEYRAKYRAYKLELIDDLKAQRDKLNLRFLICLKAKETVNANVNICACLK